ncbi:hypothetical protein BD779DRAFT_1801636 [Infundibulicybe gibba]|nr:hypothetical protein BD779DRAFT_1801636 [Infundibulicybe gibba]
MSSTAIWPGVRIPPRILLPLTSPPEVPNLQYTASLKLTSLSVQQCHELITNVYDELIRRKTDGKVPFLPVRMDFHPKRNQARQKPATLPTPRFQDLCSGVHFEFSRRVNPSGCHRYSPEWPPAALCTNANGAALKNCVQCIQSISPSPTTTQVILDQFEQGCAAIGTPVTLGGSGGSSGGGLTSHSPSATVSASKGATSPSSSSTRTATTGLGTSPSASGTAGGDGSVNQLNNSNAAGRATVGSVGLIGLAMGAAALLL